MSEWHTPQYRMSICTSPPCGSSRSKASGLRRLKEWRAVATRYEKTARSFMGVLCLAAAQDWLKGTIKGKQSSSNRS